MEVKGMGVERGERSRKEHIERERMDVVLLIGVDLSKYCEQTPG